MPDPAGGAHVTASRISLYDVTFSADGSWMYIISGKSFTGPNPGHLASSTASITSTIYPGGNAAAAKLSGVKVDRVRIGVMLTTGSRRARSTEFR